MMLQHCVVKSCKSRVLMVSDDFHFVILAIKTETSGFIHERRQRIGLLLIATQSEIETFFSRKFHSTIKRLLILRHKIVRREKRRAQHEHEQK